MRGYQSEKKLTYEIVRIFERKIFFINNNHSSNHGLAARTGKERACSITRTMKPSRSRKSLYPNELNAVLSNRMVFGLSDKKSV